MREANVTSNRYLRVAAALGLAACLASAPAQAEERSTKLQVEARCSQCFIDLDEKPRNFDAVYNAWFSHDTREPKYFIAALEQFAVLGAGTAYYWIRPSLNKVDWDFPSPTTRLQYLEAAFDNNKFKTNQVLHPVAGSAYYALARENDLSPLASAAYAAGSSAFFEFVLEWLEKVSYNDLIVTPSAGIPTGEFFFQLSRYLNSTSGAHDAGDYVAEYSLGLPAKLHGDPKGLHSRERMPSDSLGYSSAYWHRFHLAFGLGLTSSGSDTLVFERFSGEGQLFAMPGMLRPGSFATTFGEGNFSEARLHYSFGMRDLEADAAFQTTFAGYYYQDFATDEDGELRGRAAMVGGSMGYRYHDSQPANGIDQWSFVDLFGPRAQAWLAFGGAVLRVGADVHYDFGAVYALAYPQYTRVYPRDETKSVLKEQGYQFVQGGSARAEASLTYRSLELGVRRGYGRYYSIQGADRFEDEIRHQVLGTDDISETDFWMRAAAPRPLPLELSIDYNANRHINRLPPFSANRSERRMTFSLGFRL
ncbi:MAG TPA: DUF3943 domain-containing protein [Polyangiaceae bacterium]|nr:DUF3943 domain-containing protein [Polyangiaceae bacterium]